MERDESSNGAEVVRLNVPHALRDERLARMRSGDLLPYADHVEARLGPGLGPRGAALWREAVLAPAYLSPSSPPYSQAGLALAMRSALAKGLDGARPAVMPASADDPVRGVVALLFPDLHAVMEADATDEGRRRERWATVRIDYPGIDPVDLRGPAGDLILRGEPWERAFLSSLSRRAGIPELPMFVMDVFRRWRPDATDVRSVLPALAWLGPDDLPTSEVEWQACRAAVREAPAAAR